MTAFLRQQSYQNRACT